MKKIIIIVCLLISILYSFTFSYAINPIIGDVVENPEETEQRNEDNLIEVSIYTETKDVIPKDIFDEIFTEKTLTFLKNDLNAEINHLKDYVEIVLKTKMNPSTQGLVLYADDRPVEVNTEGIILIPMDTKKVSKSVLSSGDDIELKDFHIADLEKVKSEYEVVFRASSGELLVSMDEEDEKFRSDNNMSPLGYGDKYEVGDWVHCNRFNGPNTDHVHYDWRNGSAGDRAKALVNFYGSDCHVALTQAGSKCTSIGSCNCNTSERAAYCSGFVKQKWMDIDCVYTYHTHTYLVVPR